MSASRLRIGGTYLMAALVGGILFYVIFKSISIAIISAAVHDAMVYIILGWHETRHDNLQREVLNDGLDK